MRVAKHARPRCSLAGAPVMELTDVRRLTGANLIMDRGGAVGEAALPEDRAGLVVALWRREARALLAAVGWADDVLTVKFVNGAVYEYLDVPRWIYEDLIGMGGFQGSVGQYFDKAVKEAGYKYRKVK